MDLTTVLSLLVICSAVTSLMTEAFKKILSDKVSENLIVAVVSIIVGILTALVYSMITGAYVDGEYITMTIILTIASWVCAMVGYDKVVQTIDQIKNK